MLALLYQHPGTSQRKLRLFLVACCRRRWSLCRDHRGPAVIEVAERFADRLATSAERAAAAEVAAAIAGEFAEDAWGFAAVGALEDNLDLDLVEGASGIVGPRERCELLREIFGNPFHPRTAVDPALLAWHSGLVVQLAQSAYDGRSLPAGTLDSSRLAVLADALEEAGRTDAELLAHVRGPGPHVRGCWVLDLIRGKG
jgi:hypothetical protein